MRLSTTRHDRDAAGTVYVYPVVSRRARGLSIGINLNPNNACNWRCIYCQVPGLVAGRGPVIDLERLERELDAMLTDVFRGDFLERCVPPEARRLNDVAFSGNGEPTTSPSFGAAVERVVRCLRAHDPKGAIRLVVITNGSGVRRPPVQEALELLGRSGGEVWFKLDSATHQGIRDLNSARLSPRRVAANLRAAATACPTWIQTLVLERRGRPPAPDEVEAWLAFLRARLEEGLPLAGVHLYGLARPSHQPEAPELAALPAAWLEALAERVRGLGLEVRVSP